MNDKVETKLCKDVSHYSKTVLARLQIRIGNIEKLQTTHCNVEETLTKVLENPRTSERKKLTELKRTQAGIEEINKCHNDIIALAKSHILTWERWAAEVWQPKRSQHIINSHKEMIATLVNYRQPRMLIEKYEIEFDAIVDQIIKVVEAGPFDEAYQLEEVVRTFESFRIELSADLLHARRRLELLENKFIDASGPIVARLKEELTDCKYDPDVLKDANQLKKLIGARFPMEIFEKDLHAVEERLNSQGGKLAFLLGHLRNMHDCIKEYKTSLESSQDMVLQEIQSVVDIHQNSMEDSGKKMNKIVEAIQKGKSKRRIHDLETSYGNLNSEQSEQSKKHFSDIVTSIEFCKISVDEKLSELTTKYNSSVQLLTERCNDYPEIDLEGNLKEKKWMIPEHLNSKFNELLNNEAFKHQNRLNTFQFHVEDKMQCLSEQVVIPQLTAVDEDCKNRETKMHELSQELLDIRLDFHDKFEQIIDKIHVYAAEIDKLRELVIEVPATKNFSAVVKENRAKIGVWIKEIDEMLKVITEDFRDRYAKIQAHQNAANAPSQGPMIVKAASSSDLAHGAHGEMILIRDIDGLTPKQFWDGALDLYKAKCGELVPDFAKIAAIRLKDWLGRYQIRFNAEYRNMRSAGARFEEPVSFKAKEWEFMGKVDQLILEHQRNLSFLIRSRKSAITYFNEEFALYNENELINKLATLQKSLQPPTKSPQALLFENSCDAMNNQPDDGMGTWLQKLADLMTRYPLQTVSSAAEAKRKGESGSRIQTVHEDAKKRMEKQCEAYFIEQNKCFDGISFLKEEAIHSRLMLPLLFL